MKSQFESYLKGLAKQAKEYGQSFALITPSSFSLDSIEDLELRKSIAVLQGNSDRLPAHAKPGRITIVKTSALPHDVFTGLMAYSQVPPVVAGDGALSAAIALGKPFVMTRVAWNRRNIENLINRLNRQLSKNGPSARVLEEFRRGRLESPAINSAQLAPAYRALLDGIPSLTDNLVEAAYQARLRLMMSGQGNLAEILAYKDLQSKLKALIEAGTPEAQKALEEELKRNQYSLANLILSHNLKPQLLGAPGIRNFVTRTMLSSGDTASMLAAYEALSEIQDADTLGEAYAQLASQPFDQQTLKLSLLKALGKINDEAARAIIGKHVLKETDPLARGLAFELLMRSSPSFRGDAAALETFWAGCSLEFKLTLMANLLSDWTNASYSETKPLASTAFMRVLNRHFEQEAPTVQLLIAEMNKHMPQPGAPMTISPEAGAHVLEGWAEPSRRGFSLLPDWATSISEPSLRDLLMPQVGVVKPRVHEGFMNVLRSNPHSFELMDVMERIVEHGTPQQIRQAAVMAESFYEPRSVNILEKAMASRDPSVREAAASSLRTLWKHPFTFEVVEDLLSQWRGSRDPDLRALAYSLAPRPERPEIRQRLKSILTSGTKLQRYLVIKGIKGQHAPALIELKRLAIENPLHDDNLTELGFQAILGDSGPEVEKIIRHALTNGNPKAKERACLWLSHSSGLVSPELLLDAWRLERDELFRYGLIEAIDPIRKSPAALRLMLVGLQEGSQMVRQEALRKLRDYSPEFRRQLDREMNFSKHRQYWSEQAHAKGCDWILAQLAPKPIGICSELFKFLVRPPSLPPSRRP